MARRSRFPNNNVYVSAKRDDYLIANRFDLLHSLSRLRPLDLRVFEDRRLFDPLDLRRPALTFGNKVPARVVLDRPNRPFRFPDVFRFKDSRRVVLCVRRKERKEVLFAKNKLNSGRGVSKRRNEWSDVKC